MHVCYSLSGKHQEDRERQALAQSQRSTWLAAGGAGGVEGVEGGVREKEEEQEDGIEDSTSSEQAKRGAQRLVLRRTSLYKGISRVKYRKVLLIPSSPLSPAAGSFLFF